ncbi:MAG: hypothetical protein IK116_04925 [Firmicutes bacterium]|nr:hypothetical protein [Bacillota bacterium]
MSESSLQRYFALRKKGKLKNEKGPKAAYHLLRSAVFGKALPAAVAAGAAQLCDSRSNKAELARVIKAHASAEKLRDRRWLRRIRRDIYFTKFYQWIDADEYFRYQFEDLSRAGRWLYIGEKEFIERCKLADDPEELDLTKNKYKAYCALKPYYKREAVLISSPEDKQLFNDFCDR